MKETLLHNGAEFSGTNLPDGTYEFKQASPVSSQAWKVIFQLYKKYADRCRWIRLLTLQKYPTLPKRWVATKVRNYMIYQIVTLKKATKEQLLSMKLTEVAEALVVANLQSGIKEKSPNDYVKEHSEIYEWYKKNKKLATELIGDAKVSPLVPVKRFSDIERELRAVGIGNIPSRNTMTKILLSCVICEKKERTNEILHDLKLFLLASETTKEKMLIAKKMPTNKIDVDFIKHVIFN